MSDSGLVLGSLAVRYGMITTEELRVTLAKQAREVADGKLPRRIGLILLAEGLLSETDIDILLRHQQTFHTGHPL